MIQHNIPTRILAILLAMVLMCGMATACAKKPATPDELLSLGEKYLLELDYENAIVQFLKVIEIEPMNVRAYQGAAKAYKALGQTENEVAQYQKIIQIEPANLEAHKAAVEAYKMLGQPQNAVTHYLRIIEIEPANIPAHVEAVKLYNELGQPENTIALYLKLIKLEPVNVQFYNGLGETYVALGQPESAVAQYLKVIELEPENAEAHRLMANLYITLEQPENAVTQYLKVIELEPENVEIHQLVAELYTTIEQPENAVTQYLKVIELEPENLEMHQLVANLYITLKQPENAGAQYLKIIELEPNNVEMYRILADLYNTLGQLNKALAILEQGIQATGDEELRVKYEALKPKPVVVAPKPAPKPAPAPQPAPEPETNPYDVGDDKPVIYLYPEEKMNVSVKVNLKDARFTCTYPDYGTGWNVVASPDGSLTNLRDNKEYSYLYWEAIGDVDYDMSKGFVVKGKDTAEFLQEKLAYMGLTPREYNEFIVFWLPLMQENPYNLIAFQGERYIEHAELVVSPTPDSVLRVFMAYQPLQKPISVPEQKLSQFTRKGFAVVEWGGSCITENKGHVTVQ